MNDIFDVALDECYEVNRVTDMILSIRAIKLGKLYKEIATYYKYKSQAYRTDEGVIQDIGNIEWNIMRLEKLIKELEYE